jgi:predicted lipid carrier protein YhbT
MIPRTRLSIENAALVLGSAILFTLGCANFAPRLAAQTPSGTGASAQATVSSHDRWLHVRVTNPNSNDESVRVNVPLELAVKILPTINQHRLHSGKVSFDEADCHGVDVRALLDAVRTSKDGEFVTVQNKDSDVRVAKQSGYLFVHVFEKNHPKRSQVEVKVPLKVVDALLSGGKDELDLVAGLRALSAQGDTELVSVKDEENTVRVWLDSKNVSD